MKVIIIGGGSLGSDLSRLLIEERHQVVLIEREEVRANELAECLDCSVIHAEGTRPDILEKAGIEHADAVVAVTTHDQDNIIIGLIARTFNVKEIIIRTDDQDYLTVANKLGFHRVVNPAHTTSVIIADALRGVDTIEPLHPDPGRGAIRRGHGGKAPGRETPRRPPAAGEHNVRGDIPGRGFHFCPGQRSAHGGRRGAGGDQRGEHPGTGPSPSGRSTPASAVRYCDFPSQGIQFRVGYSVISFQKAHGSQRTVSRFLVRVTPIPLETLFSISL